MPRPEPEVPAEAIDAEIERMRESLAGLDTVERAAGDGDFILIDYAGEIDGEAFEGGAATDFLLELGSETLIEGFNEQLTGSSAGETRTVEVTFPDEYHAEHLSGKEASFEVAVKEVREKSLPELDDDFAADNSDFDTLEELRADIESRLLHQAEHQVEHQFNDAALDAAVANATIEIPEEIAQARATEMWERVERTLQQRGMDPNTYLQIQGKDRDEAIADSREEAEAGLKREAVLAAVAEAEGDRGLRGGAARGPGAAGRREGQAREAAEANPRRGPRRSPRRGDQDAEGRGADRRGGEAGRGARRGAAGGRRGRSGGGEALDARGRGSGRGRRRGSLDPRRRRKTSGEPARVRAGAAGGHLAVLNFCFGTLQILLLRSNLFVLIVPATALPWRLTLPWRHDLQPDRVVGEDDR